MKNLLMITSAMLLAAGCAERGDRANMNSNDRYAMGATDGSVNTDAGAASSQGGGARALVNGRPDANYPAGTTVEKGVVTTSEPTTDISSQGAGARALEGGTLSATGASSGSSARMDDATFVREASQAGMAEVRMGKLALQRASDNQIKDCAQKLVDDHNKANEELTQIASQKGLQPATELSSTENMKLQKLEQANGQDFDRLFTKENLTAHEKAVKLFRTAQTSLKDPELRAFAQRTLPTLEAHLKMVKEMKNHGTSAHTGIDASNSTDSTK